MALVATFTPETPPAVGLSLELWTFPGSALGVASCKFLMKEFIRAHSFTNTSLRIVSRSVSSPYAVLHLQPSTSICILTRPPAHDTYTPALPQGPLSSLQTPPTSSAAVPLVMDTGNLAFVSAYVVCIDLTPILWLQRYVRPFLFILLSPHNEDCP